jgi:hypothetical protein
VSLRIAALVLTMAGLLSGVGGASASPRVFSTHGISFGYPSGWHATTKPLSNGTEPVYRFAVGNFRFRRTPRDTGPCLAGIAAERPRNGVLAFMREALGADRRRSLPRTRSRPRHFSLPRRAEDAWCLGPRSRQSVFHTAGRVFYLAVSVGPTASRADKRRLLDLLNTMSVK